MSCSGGNPGATVTGNLTVFANAPVTNRVTGTMLSGVTLAYDNGSGPQPTVPATLASSSSIAFNNASFTLSAAGSVTLRLSDLRVNVTAQSTPLTVFMGFNPGNVLLMSSAQFVVAYPRPGLYLGSSGKLICSVSGSPAPDNTGSFTSFLSAGTAFSTTRLTEGFGDAFQPANSYANLGADNGHRFLIGYSSFPQVAHLYVPDLVAGSDAQQPTAGGDFGPPASGGTYAPGSLLLSRVKNATATGAGGMVTPAPAAAVTFDSVSEVPLDNTGSGYAVYEVVDANNSVQESLQFPTFLVLPRGSVDAPIETAETVSFAAVSTVGTTTSTDPIPRFLAVTPQPDCTIVGDCHAKYNPSLYVDTTPIQYTAQAGAGNQAQYFIVNNRGGGVLEWTATISYTNGTGWLKLYPDSGINNGTIRVDAFPANLTPGVYQAVITINAGPIAGQQTVPITLTVNPVPAPAITSVVNAASFAAGPVSPGSLATVMGSGFTGKTISVTFDGTLAQVLFSNGTQINLLVPANLSGKSSSQMVVTVDGLSSAPQTVALAPFSPAIFAGGVLNQDYSVNSAANPAVPGSVLQIFATGLSGHGTISVQIGGQTVGAPAYAGPAPGLAGVQQVNVVIESTGDLSVCGLSICSPTVRVYVNQP
ncbi:MAG TPA: IPT/TIG domain-containing protein [Bryobacteraceae bacterium]|nr:IPT/TIG domain-containing protein [Bryobacteraceae bacterium]